MSATKQTSLASMFSGKKDVSKKAVETATAATTTSVATKVLTHPNPLVQEYYDQLTQAQTTAHRLAIEKLGTSYDVVRTHGFLRWMKARPQ